MQGKVKFFDRIKGFGFIAADNGEDVFFHSSGLVDPTTILTKDDVVEFEVTQGTRGPKALNVKKL